ncbi:biotin carboxylase [Pseudomaricurvus alkylphenolicus]|uniref:ATP-binding protein n=1 Tax=Pseudomaricurvus alkylphenolicus TaxID=1306991 RepID=UPI00141EE8AD|nr:biotin carboxylase [Pseudomaricurvus alkylphenolicus]NIB38104.1 biotin carboxylase [Pseudomaricurvus alkylphenolicus]
MTNENKLQGLSDIYRFFRKNKTPIYFVSPTAYNVLGIGQWVQSFKYVTFFDSFDGGHFRITNPKLEGEREFQSMEDMVNYLLSHKQTSDLLEANGGGGKLLTVMFDEETEAIAKRLGLEMALPPASLRKHIDSKIVTTQLANEAGVPSAPNLVDVTADTYDALMELATEARLGENLVVQTPYGDSGKTTFFIRNREDWDKHADNIVGETLKVMKYINHVPGTVEAVATRCGTLVGPLQTDITGYAELTPYKGGWCGNDIIPGLLAGKQREKIISMVKAMGDKLYEQGYRGAFCFDYLVDTDDGEVYLGEINPRISGASPLTNLVTSKYGGAPLMLFHLLEFMDVDFEFDYDLVQSRWADFGSWTQLVLKHTEDQVRLITKAPKSGIWRMGDDGEIEYVRQSIDWNNVGDEEDAFYLRVYGEGEYSYLGADMGIIVARGRMQSDDRELLPRAKQWINPINRQFEFQALDESAAPYIPNESVRKMI